ncbi:MAG: hypothetical protein EBS54_01425 [Betaproteobacteria bacterium]|nr:hypothetical protein [Betaproteobacteria bacterium]
MTTDAPEAHQTLLNTVGIFHGSMHPEFSYLLCTEGSITETDRQHAEITYRYEVPQVGSQDSQPNPLARPDVWSFSTGGAAVPALVYYQGSGNSNRKALINTAGDFFESAMTEEAELRCSISGNRSAFPVAVAAQVTNCVNSDAFMGAAVHQWKCQGISGQQQVEVVNGVEIKYWSVTVELAYRQSGWNLLLPNVGWNYISQAGTGNAEKRRCFVYDENKEKVASANVLALNDDGSIRFNTDFTGSGAPTVLNRRVHPEIAFTPLFGTSPF